MGSKITYNAEVWPLVLTPQIADEIFTKGGHLLHWLGLEKKELIERIIDPNFQFFGLVNGSKFLGLVWVYDFEQEQKSAKCGTLVWERIGNFKDLIEKGFYVFDLDELKADVDKETNMLSKRLLKSLGFIKSEGTYLRRK